MLKKKDMAQISWKKKRCIWPKPFSFLQPQIKIFLYKKKNARYSISIFIEILEISFTQGVLHSTIRDPKSFLLAGRFKFET